MINKASAHPVTGKKDKITKQELKERIGPSDITFVTAGMGGGTGTGAAPVVAEIAQGLGALTVAIVTKPFTFEGRKRMENAIVGLDELKKHVDTANRREKLNFSLRRLSPWRAILRRERNCIFSSLHAYHENGCPLFQIPAHEQGHPLSRWKE